MTRKFIFAILLLCGTALAAHEFWLEPQRFNLKRGETLKLNFRVGEEFKGENWNGNRSSVNSIKLFYNGIEDNLTELIPEDEPGDSLSLQFFDEGTGVVSYQSTNKYIELDPAKFLEYLKEDGLSNAIAYRASHNENDSSGREYYQRSVKTIFQVGSNHDDTYKKNCGLPLEFIPLSHPYQVKKGQTLTFKLLFNDAPLKGALVKLWHRSNGKTTKEEFTTTEDGLIRLSPSTVGRYMLSAVNMQRIDSSSAAQWQSYWSSVTWGY
jgi:uncharacterized GH25 family protein